MDEVAAMRDEAANARGDAESAELAAKVMAERAASAERSVRDLDLKLAEANVALSQATAKAERLEACLDVARAETAEASRAKAMLVAEAADADVRATMLRVEESTSSVLQRVQTHRIQAADEQIAEDDLEGQGASVADTQDNGDGLTFGGHAKRTDKQRYAIAGERLSKGAAEDNDFEKVRDDLEPPATRAVDSSDDIEIDDAPRMHKLELD